MNINEISILICDDSIMIRKKLKDHISTLGCGALYEAVNGQEAVDIYKEKKPTLVFMDIVMPVKSGIEALAEILEYDKNAKVLMASSAGTQTNFKIAIDAGAFDFLQKPIDNELIDKIINNMIEGDE